MDHTRHATACQRPAIGDGARSLLRSTALAGSLALLAISATGCGNSGHQSPAARRSRPSTPLYSGRAAGSAAGGLLAAVPLPVKTHRVGQLTVADAKRLVRPGNSERFAKSVDRPAYWISMDRPQAILAFLAANGPAPKPQYSGYGGVRRRTEGWSETLEVPTGTPLSGPRQLFVSVVLTGRARYAVRIDAVVAWHQRPPASSLVPSSARWLRVTVLEPAFHGFRGEPSRPRRTRSLITATVHTVQAVADAVNELPVAEPTGPQPSCPAMSIANSFARTKIILTFRRIPSGSNLAEAVTDTGYVCDRAGEASAKITTPRLWHGLLLSDHLNSVTVTEGASLAGRIEAAFDHRLHLPARR